MQAFPQMSQFQGRAFWHVLVIPIIGQPNYWIKMTSCQFFTYERFSTLYVSPGMFMPPVILLISSEAIC